MRPDHRPAFHPSLREQSTIAAERPEDWPDHERGYVALDGRAVSQHEPQSETMERRVFVYSQEAHQKNYDGSGVPHLLKNVTFSTGSRDTAPNFPIGHPIGKIANVSAFSGSPNASFTSFSYRR